MARRLLWFQRIRYGPIRQRARPAECAYNPSTGTYARGASTSTAYGNQAVGQAYNPNTGAYAATHQASNAYGSYGSSVVSKNGNTAYTQHQTTAQGSVGTVQTSAGGKGAAASGAYGNSGAAGQTANGNKYAAANGNVYKNTGSGWNQTQGNAATIHLKLLGSQLCCCSRLWRAGKEQRVIGLWRRRRRLAIQGGQCSRFGKPRRWWRLGRSQMKPTVRRRRSNLVRRC